MTISTLDFPKGMAAGFIIGVAVIGAAVVLLYRHDDTVHELNAERIEKLEANVHRLELAVNRLSGRVADIAPLDAGPEATPVKLTSVSAPARDSDRVP
jgi:hypothetical protein